MTNTEKAMKILEALEDSSAPITVNWSMKDMYIKAIEKALNEIEEDGR